MSAFDIFCLFLACFTVIPKTVMIALDGIIAALVPFEAFHFFLKEKLQTGGYIPLFWF